MNDYEMSMYSRRVVEEGFCRALEAHGKKTFADKSTVKRKGEPRFVHVRKGSNDCLATDLARFRAAKLGVSVESVRAEMRAEGVVFRDGGER